MKKRIASLLLAATLTGGIIMTSCTDNSVGTSSAEEASSGTVSENVSESVSEPISEPETPVNPDASNIAFGCPYLYDCGFSVEGDDYMKALTDGDKTGAVTLKTNLSSNGEEKTLTFTDWYGGTHTEVLDNSTIAITVDLGFMAYAESAVLSFTQYSGKAIKVFASTDGYNFTYYLGEYSGWDESSKTFTSSLGRAYVKALMFVIPAESGEEVKLSEIAVRGEKTAEKKLLSFGASYEWKGASLKAYPDDGVKLTDGRFFTGDTVSQLVGKSGSQYDALTKRSGNVVTLDLGEIKNISEVAIGAYSGNGSGTLPTRIDVRYSEDGENWTDFGQSWLRSQNGKSGCGNVFLVTRNHTVKARYVTVYTYVSALFCTDEIAVYGSDSEVTEPDYGYVDKINSFSNSNVASYTSASLNGSEDAKLTDMLLTTTVKAQSGSNTLSVTLDGSVSGLTGFAISAKGEITDLKVTADGKEVASSQYSTSVAGFDTYYLFADSTVSGKNIVFTFNASGALIRQALVYAGRSQIPFVRGGFFQLPTSGASNPSSQNSDYTWYLQLKGMRDLGMEYVVIQYSTHYLAKTTLINGENIIKAGYKYNANYGSADVCKAVLDAAEKLGMKVWLGTIHDSDFTDPVGNMASYEGLVADSYAIIRDIASMYGDHPAFGGYYLSDETCDQWLNMKGGVDAARYVYKNQSDFIHQIDPDALIMIAPAIWRSGSAVTGGDNLYRLVAPDENGGRPVVDIVAAQDCLGREGSLKVGDAAYQSYISYVEQWAKAVRRAGAEFWHDAEVFEITSTQKRYGDIIETLDIEAPFSGTTIVFDIPHYFSSYPMSTVNDYYDYYKRLIMRDYAEYYSGIRALADANSEAEAPSVNDDDGRKVDMSDVSVVTPPSTEGKIYNEGFLLSGVPDTANISWHDFSSGNGSGVKPQYALYWDKDNLYAVIKTNDTTADFKDGTWWNGKDDLIQIWISGDGSISSDALENDYGVRYYIHRKGESVFTDGGQAGAKATFGGFKYVYKDGVFVVSMPWSSIGRTSPSAGDGTAVGINVQYIDGADSSWASSTGNSGRSITSKELYSF